ncbi:MAG: ABC transporter permease subunit, partial [Actinomycetota bacterium]
LPGVVVALALIGIASGPVPVLAGSATLVVAAHAVRYLPEAVGAMRGSMARVPASLEEAARALGARPASAFLRVTLRLSAGGLVAGGLLVFLSAMKELPATLLLRPPGFDTLAVRVWVDSSEGLYRDAAAPALLLIGLCAAALVPLLRGGRGGDVL